MKQRLLEHIADLADNGPEFQSALCDGKITADVCVCFLTGSVTVRRKGFLGPARRPGWARGHASGPLSTGLRVVL